MNRDWLSQRAENGLSQREIAAESGKSQTTVRYWLNKHGITTSVAKPSDCLPPVAAAPAVKPSLPIPVAAELKDTSWIGSCTEAAVLNVLTAAGFPCYIPFGVGKADMVIETAEGIKSVQCKTGRVKSDGATVSFRTFTVLRSGGRVGYAGIVDYFGVACPEMPGNVWLVPTEDTGQGVCSLRLKPTANGQQTGSKPEFGMLTIISSPR